LGQIHDAVIEMPHFDPASIQMACGLRHKNVLIDFGAA
jgi:hypothetical protein